MVESSGRRSAGDQRRPGMPRPLLWLWLFLLVGQSVSLVRRWEGDIGDYLYLALLATFGGLLVHGFARAYGRGTSARARDAGPDEAR